VISSFVRGFHYSRKPDILHIQDFSPDVDTLAKDARIFVSNIKADGFVDGLIEAFDVTQDA
jgi:hypothetical protein